MVLRQTSLQRADCVWRSGCLQEGLRCVKAHESPHVRHAWNVLASSRSLQVMWLILSSLIMNQFTRAQAAIPLHDLQGHTEVVLFLSSEMEIILITSWEEGGLARWAGYTSTNLTIYWCIYVFPARRGSLHSWWGWSAYTPEVPPWSSSSAHTPPIACPRSDSVSGGEEITH